MTLYVSKNPDSLGSQRKRDSVNSDLKWEHLTKPVLILAHQSSHFILFLVDHSSRTIIICDSLSKTSSLHAHDILIQRIMNWLAESHAKKRQADGLQPSPAPTYTVHVQDVPQQIDGNSCGAFAVAFAYFSAHHGRPPTVADFNGGDSRCLRLAVLDMCIGTVKKPLSAQRRRTGRGPAAR